MTLDIALGSNIACAAIAVRRLKLWAPGAPPHWGSHYYVGAAVAA